MMGKDDDGMRPAGASEVPLTAAIRAFLLAVFAERAAARGLATARGGRGRRDAAPRRGHLALEACPSALETMTQINVRS
jgi:hypothetical protein